MNAGNAHRYQLRMPSTAEMVNTKFPACGTARQTTRLRRIRVSILYTVQILRAHPERALAITADMQLSGVVALVSVEGCDAKTICMGIVWGDAR